MTQVAALRLLRHPLVVLSATVVALVVAGWIFLTSGSEAVTGRATTRVAASETVTVGAATAAPAVAKGFVGLAIEYQSVAADAGSAADPDTVMQNLVTALDPGQRPIIRIGGDSTDHTWWPVTGVENPGLTYALTPSWLASVANFATSTDADLILGIDLEVDEPKIAAAEAQALLRGIGAAHILQWEVGNEPSLYSAFPWYTTVKGAVRTAFYTRPRTFSFDDYLKQYSASATALPRIALAGPALGSPRWMVNLPRMLKAEPDLTDVTYHAYPLNCYVTKASPQYPSIADLLTRFASVGLAAQVVPFVDEARAAGRSFRVDELNTSACGGTAGVSDTFASALWATDTLFAMASRGVSGVNIQDFNSSRYKPFSFSLVDGHWVAQVEPIYYGLLLFSRAAPAGSKLLSVSTTGASAVHAWAAQTPATEPGATGPETVTLINDSVSHPETVTVSAAGTSGGTLARMLAPGAAATGGVTLAGMSYGSSTSTGELTGTSTVTSIRPAANGTYSVTLAPASAALLTLDR